MFVENDNVELQTFKKSEKLVSGWVIRRERIKSSLNFLKNINRSEVAKILSYKRRRS